MNGFPERGNPQEPDALVGEVQGGFDELASFPSRLTRYSQARSHAVDTLGHLRQFAQDPAFNPFEQDTFRRCVAEMQPCGEYLHFRAYHSVSKVKLHAFNSCRIHLLCPLCAIRRGSKGLSVYLDRYRLVMDSNPELKGAMATLTVKDGPDLLERFNHLRNLVHQLLKRRSYARSGGRVITEWAKVEGLVGSYEFKRGKNSGEWHPHVHIAILYPGWLDYEAMREEIRRISGDSHVFRIDPFQHPEAPERDFVEVFKYAVCFQDLVPRDLAHAYLTLKSRRLLFSAGCFWGLKIPESLNDEPLDGLPFFDLLYRFVGRSYSLVASGSASDGWEVFERDVNEGLRQFGHLRGTSKREFAK
jgi:hypothetical protein